MHAILLAAALVAAPPFTALDKTGPENAVRHISGTELSDTLRKAKKPGDFYAQALLSKGEHYQVINTLRDKDGQAEIHAAWNDNVFVQEGEASFVTGGTAVDAKDTALGEKRGTAIAGGVTMSMRPGDYFFVPAGTPHQMKVAPGQHIKFIAFKTHK
jgi:mannose-6-phosphate isomerase-like protein (cupin superfamily)